jgi:predicted nucleic acid-binding Zn ribbon protein
MARNIQEMKDSISAQTRAGWVAGSGPATVRDLRLSISNLNTNKNGRPLSKAAAVFWELRHPNG